MMRSTLLAKYPDIVLSPRSTLRNAIEAITKTQVGIALVVADDHRLLGIVVDSDIRKSVLRETSLDVSVTEVMNQKPVVADVSLADEAITALFRQNPKAYIPLVDRAGRLVEVASLSDYLVLTNHYTNVVVIMAGGQGQRLRPLTSNCPKPMMQIGNKPILEHTLMYLTGFGLTDFIISVNYLEEQIREHFRDGSKWGVNIEYLSEPMQMGTAGALGLIERSIDKPFIVMNGDLLTKVNLHAVLDYHKVEGNVGTVCVREYEFQVPYGVVCLQDSKLTSIVEKPIHRSYVNAGIYVFEPQVLQWVKKLSACDMPDFLADVLVRSCGNVGCFPIKEYWLDIGRMEDYQRAVREHEKDV